MLLLFFWADSVFCCSIHSFEFQLDSFLVFLHLMNVGNLIYSLDTIHQILFGGFIAACILSLWPLMSPPQKRNGKEFCGEVFSQGRKDYQTRSHSSNGQHHKLGYSPCHPTGHIKLSVCTHFNFVFRAPFYFCINLERLYLVFMFFFCIFILNKKTTTCRYS